MPLKVLSAWYRSVRRACYLAFVCRVPLVSALIVLLAGAIAEQVHEVARIHILEFGTGQSTGLGPRTALEFIFFALLWQSWTVLHWSHYAIDQRFPAPLANTRALRATRMHLAKVLAALPWLGFIFALLQAGLTLTGGARYFAFFTVAASFALGVVVISAYHNKLWTNTFERGRPPARQSGVQSALNRRWMIASFSIGAVLFLAAVVNPIAVGQSLGSIFLLIGACAALVPALTWLTASPSSPSFPWLAGLLVAALLFSSLDLNDNHGLRQLPGEPKSSLSDGNAAYGNLLQHWLASRTKRDSETPYPVVFVSAEGGGIRAAYFTAQVLAAIQDRCPAFARHLFAISGVSGGSLGASVFAGLVDASSAADSSGLACSEDVQNGSSFSLKSDEVLRADFLGPVVASLLFPDALQRFLPLPVPGFDRAKTLEIAIEQEFRKVVGTDFLERSVYGYWKAERNLPVLMLNATNVETGERTVASPALPLEEGFHRLTSFRDFDPSADFRISTMSVVSARFPLVTPAASLDTAFGKRRFVDGGYFENSGAATLTEAVDVALKAAKQYGYKIRPVVIRIGNSPSMLAAVNREKAARPEVFPTGMGELLSPVRTFINTRGARGALAAEMLKTRVASMQEEGQPSDYVEFQIGVDDVPLPLGWQLASTTRQALVAQLAAPIDCESRKRIVNGCAVLDVIQTLRR
ncbi:MAG: hypothetical protein QM702_05145 [Rubrivivax sp.]